MVLWMLKLRIPSTRNAPNLGKHRSGARAHKAAFLDFDCKGALVRFGCR